MADAPVQEGDILAGKYRVERVLGEGGMGVVVAAWHIELEQRVAMKFLLPELAQRGDAAERFRREARAAVRIKSEHVARVLDVGTLDEGVPYMVMEFLEGHDLSQELSERGTLEVEEAVQFVLQACEAIAEAHAAGIVHRDLKPANLFVTERADGSRVIKVLDFGISKSLTGGSDMSLTRTAAIIGSPLYMSPEQMDSAKDVDQRADIWALGVILFELLAGRPPYNGSSIPQLCAAILNDDPPSLTDFRSDVSIELSVAVQTCLQKKLDQRFASVAELVEAVGRFGPLGSHVSIDRVQRVLGRSAGKTTGPVRFPSGSDISGARTVPSSPGLAASPEVDVLPMATGAAPGVSSGHTVASWGRTGAASKLPRRAPLWIGAGLLVVLVGAVALWALGTSGARAETNLAAARGSAVGEAPVTRSATPPAVEPVAEPVAATPPAAPSVTSAPAPELAPAAQPKRPKPVVNAKPARPATAKPATSKPAASGGVTDFGGRN